MENLKIVWEWLSGRKTKIAALFFLFQQRIVPLWFEGDVPDTLAKTLMTITEILLFIGLGDSVIKRAKRGGTQ